MFNVIFFFWLCHKTDSFIVGPIKWTFLLTDVQARLNFAVSISNNDSFFMIRLKLFFHNVFDEHPDKAAGTVTLECQWNMKIYITNISKNMITHICEKMPVKYIHEFLTSRVLWLNWNMIRQWITTKTSRDRCNEYPQHMFLWKNKKT